MQFWVFCYWVSITQRVLPFSLIQMIAAKVQSFREQIRKRQIHQRRNITRHQILQQQLQEARSASSPDCVEEYMTQRGELERALNNHDLFRVLQSLEMLKKLSAGLPEAAQGILAQKQFGLIEILSQSLKVLSIVTQNDTDTHRVAPIVHNCFSIMRNYSWHQSITEQRILSSQFLEAAISILRRPMQISRHKMDNIMCVLSNLMKDRREVALLVEKTRLHELVIHYALETPLNPSDEVVRSFLFFLKSFLELLDVAPPVEQESLKTCFKGVRISFDTFLQQGFGNSENVNALEDCICILKNMINLDMIDYNQPLLNLSELVDVAIISSCPLQIKTEILMLLDICIFKDKQQLTEYLVNDCNILTKIWGAAEESKYIVLNICANVAVHPSLKPALKGFLSSIRMLMSLEPWIKQIYIFLLNYFWSQEYQILSPLQEDLVNALWDIEETSKENKRIQARIWQGLISEGCQIIPQQRLVDDEDLQECEELRFLMEHRLGMRDI